MKPCVLAGSRALFLTAVGLMLALFSQPVFATFSAPPIAHISVVPYLNPNTGRFWTRDTYEGKNADPLSLHKYLHAAANPVMNIDPSGQFSFVEILVAGLNSVLTRAREAPAAAGAYITAQNTITKAVAIAIAAYMGGLYAYDELAGEPPNNLQAKKIEKAIETVQGDGFAELANRARTLRFRVVDDLLDTKDGWGYTPYWAVRTVWLDPHIFSWDDSAFASILIHETHHTMHMFTKEKTAYQIQSDFLWTEGVAGTARGVARQLPNTDFNWMKVTAENMRDKGVMSPAIKP